MFNRTTKIIHIELLQNADIETLTSQNVILKYLYLYNIKMYCQ